MNGWKDMTPKLDVCLGHNDKGGGWVGWFWELGV